MATKTKPRKRTSGKTVKTVVPAEQRPDHPKAQHVTTSRYRADPSIVRPVPHDNFYVVPGRRIKTDPFHVMRRPPINVGVGLGIPSTVRCTPSTVKPTNSRIPSTRIKQKKRLDKRNLAHRVPKAIGVEYEAKVIDQQHQYEYDQFEAARKAHVRICRETATQQDYTLWAGVRNWLERTRSPLYDELVDIEAKHEQTYLPA